MHRSSFKLEALHVRFLNKMIQGETLGEASQRLHCSTLGPGSEERQCCNTMQPPCDGSHGKAAVLHSVGSIINKAWPGRGVAIRGCFISPWLRSASPYFFGLCGGSADS